MKLILEMTELMREEQRIKLNTDWSYTFKYDKFHVLSAEVYKSTIIEYANRFGIQIESFHVY